MSWLMIIVGAVMAVLPGVLDPMGAVNGLTLLGVVLMTVGTVRVALRS